MKKLFLDTNIILDLLSKREPFYFDSAMLFSSADKAEYSIHTSTLTIATTYYIISQQLKQEDARTTIRRLKLLIDVLSQDDRIIDLALNDDSFQDFEDGIQYYTVLENELDVIITRNLKDFKNSKIPVMTAEQFIKTINLNNEIKTTKMKTTDTIKQSWNQLYGADSEDKLNDFLEYLEDFKKSRIIKPQEPEWYKDAIVYSLYVDLFNKDFQGLTDKLDYIRNLGVNCLWLLPILDSPMRDAGFDIRQYTKVRDDLLGLPADATDTEKRNIFSRFLHEAHQRGIRVIFDIAMNHTSDQHPWFQESRKSPDNPYRDYYIWNKDTNRYKETRLLFKGMEESNWEQDGEWYYFHRFFGFQPDLNYRSPQVLTEMAKNLLFWLGEGVDGFRADAIPYLWKEESTDCENLPETHTIVKFFRAVLDYVRPNTLLLAEACQKPVEVVKYFGDGDECHAGYHFPLMPQMFKAIAMESNKPVRETLSSKVTPEIPEAAQWFTFLRCHDELSLELVYVSEEDRAYIHKNYCHKPEWDFRVGEGISARLSELMERNPDKIALAYSIMLTLPGTPIIYYGDEFGKLNDEAYYREKIKETGKDDTRFLVRGKIDWEQLENDLKNAGSLPAKVFSKISEQVKKRKKYKAFGRGSIYWVDAMNPDKTRNNHILAYIRKWEAQRILIIQNLSSEKQTFRMSMLPEISWTDMFGKKADYDEKNQLVSMEGLEYLWIKL